MKQRIFCPESELGKLDPQFELEVTFPIEDESKTKIKATFGMGDRQIGDTHEYTTESMKDNAWVPKGMAVPGGSVSLQFKAHGFGAEDKADDDDTWMM